MELIHHTASIACYMYARGQKIQCWLQNVKRKRRVNNSTYETVGSDVLRTIVTRFSGFGEVRHVQ